MVSDDLETRISLKTVVRSQNSAAFTVSTTSLTGVCKRQQRTREAAEISGRLILVEVSYYRVSIAMQDR